MSVDVEADRQAIEEGEWAPDHRDALVYLDEIEQLQQQVKQLQELLAAVEDEMPGGEDYLIAMSAEIERNCTIGSFLSDYPMS